MATYVALFNWTDQGVKNARDSVNRVNQTQSMFESMGVNIKTIVWTQGGYDLVGIVEAPDDETMATAVLRLAGAGNVRTTTLRGFSAEEMGKILSNLG